MLSCQYFLFQIQLEKGKLELIFCGWCSFGGHENLFSLKGFLLIVAGGFLIGFGTRYAGGCTSGHSIMGLSSLQWPSLVATICFMIGGLIAANLLIPNILKF